MKTTPSALRAPVLRLVLASFASLSLLLGACASSGGSTSASDDPHAETRALYRRRCSQCHAPYPASSYTDAQWGQVMLDMKKEANLDDEQASAVLAWLRDSN